MQSSTKRLLSLVIVLAMALSMLPMMVFAETPSTLYVKPNANWMQSGARFAAYFFGAGETWVDCTDADGDGIYEVILPTGGYTHIIFCRMNPNAAANSWNNKWNQTSDLKLPTDDSKPCYVVAENTWDKGNGQWVAYTPEGGAGETEPTTASPIKYSVAGEATLCGSGWAPEDINNMMTDDDNDGIYSITYENVAAGTYQFKVTDGTWNNSWGKPNSADNYSLTLEADASTVEIRFDTATNLVEVIIDGETPEPPVTEPTDPPVTEPSEPFVPGVQEYCLVGYINGADYGCNDDYENVGEYIFVDGTLTTSFSADSYIFVKTTDNAKWYLAESYCQDTTCTFVENASEKMYVPANLTLTFTLVENADGTVTVSYVAGEASPDEPTPPVTEPTDPSQPDEPVAKTYYVVGSFNGWNPADAAYIMNPNGDGTYSLTFPVTAGEVQLKVTGGNWDDGNNWGDNGANIVGNVGSDRDITVTFNAETFEITVEGFDAKEPVVIDSVHVAGAAGLTGFEWDPTANMMTNVNGVYTITFENVAAGTYEFKFVANGTWDLNWTANTLMESETVYDAQVGVMGNSSVKVDVDGSKVVLIFDSNTMDIYTGEGATMRAVVIVPSIAMDATISGNVVSGAEGEVTIELIADGETVASVPASGKEGTYSIVEVAAGTYTLKVSQLNHVTREYTVTVENENVTADVAIYLIGDIDGSGAVNMGDISAMYSHIKGTKTIADEYQLLVANVNGDALNMGDLSALYAHIKGTKKLY